MLIHYTKCPVCSSEQITFRETIKDHSVSQESFEVWECQECSHCFTQDVPDQNNIGPYYASEAYISHSDTKEGLFNKAYHFARDIMLRSKRQLVTAQFSSGSHLLDIGAGTGYFLHEMKKAEWKIQGIEADPGARKLSNDKFDLGVEDVDLLDKIEKESLHAVSMWHVLEHVHQLQHYMQRIHQILRPEGRLFIAVPNCTSHDAQHYGTAWAGWDVPRHLYHFTPASMQRLAEINSFKIVERKGMPFDPFYVSMLSEKYKDKPGGAVSGILRGGLSLVSGTGNIERSSSIIYVMEKI